MFKGTVSRELRYCCISIDSSFFRGGDTHYTIWILLKGPFASLKNVWLRNGILSGRFRCVSSFCPRNQYQDHYIALRYNRSTVMLYDSAAAPAHFKIWLKISSGMSTYGEPAVTSYRMAVPCLHRNAILRGHKFQLHLELSRPYTIADPYIGWTFF